MYSFKYKQTTSSYEICHEVKDGSVMKSIFIFCKMYSLNSVAKNCPEEKYTGITPSYHTVTVK